MVVQNLQVGIIGDLNNINLISKVPIIPILASPEQTIYNSYHGDTFLDLGEIWSKSLKFGT